ncbi:MAG: 2-C-methyl-D-erythritol 4-phosphate cytidylyltransferase [Thermoleophilaceae bacterium]
MPAAGSGERLGAGGPKAFATCAGRPLLEWSLDVLEAVCDRVVVAVPAGYEHGADRVRGAASRSASVREALRAAPEATVAVVHDAARPLVSRELVQRCLDMLAAGGCDAAVAAAPMTDTVKEVATDGTRDPHPPPRGTLERADPAGVRRRRAPPGPGSRRRRPGRGHRRLLARRGRRRSGQARRGPAREPEGHERRRSWRWPRPGCGDRELRAAARG